MEVHARSLRKQLHRPVPGWGELLRKSPFVAEKAVRYSDSGLLLPLLADSKLSYQIQEAAKRSNESLDRYRDGKIYNPDAYIDVRDHSKPRISNFSDLLQVTIPKTPGEQ